ncbi:MAG TPA: glutathione S-transferase family protein [Dongiaceae bacterium]|jgi:glutathione S-transferase|nr:glutathione S-transferase family protein [Dongiaceae bacterium]
MLKLRHSTTSPFVRKAVVTAIETGQDSEIERVKTVTSDPALGADNPLQKIPALVLEDGTRLIDSKVICEYLDQRKGGKLIPASGPKRWAVLARQALCDGILDAAILRRYETQRPETLRSTEWDAKQKLKMDQGLAALERDARGFGDAVDLGTLTAAIMLDYLDFRFAHENWRQKHPSLATWYAAFSQRPSLQSTRPQD